MDSKELLCAEFTYPLAITLTMGLSLLSMWVSMLTSMLAPGLALRGPQGSMDACVRMIGEEYQSALFILACALLMTFVSAMFWAWSSNFFLVAIGLTVIIVMSVYAMYITALHTVKMFDVKRGDLVTGRMISRRQSCGYSARLRPAGQRQHRWYRRLPDDPAEGPSSPPLRQRWWGYRFLDQVDHYVPGFHQFRLDTVLR